MLRAKCSGPRRLTGLDLKLEIASGLIISLSFKVTYFVNLGKSFG